MDSYDLVVVGGGSAGQTAAVIAGKAGAKVLLVDRDHLGGDCLHHGCVPSKALIACAKVAHSARNSSSFGVHTGPIRVDYGQVRRHVKKAIETIGQGESPEAFEDRGVEVAFGGAEFLAPTHLRIGQREVDAKKTILAVGSRAHPPLLKGLTDMMAEGRVIDHVGLFEMTRLPERLAVIGGGPIGVEMGQALARLGAEVTLLHRGPGILPRDDQELSALLETMLTEDLRVMTSSSPTEIRIDGEELAVVYTHGGRSQTVRCDRVLVATGRKPNLEALKLEQAGVEFDDRGIRVDAKLKTSAATIWACGDCVGSFQFTHFAEAQARVATRNALFTGNQRFTETNIPWATFSDPELAHVGLLESQVREQGTPHDVYRFGYEDLDRAVCEGVAHGLAKLVCDPDGRILGASILGPQAAEAITEITVAMKARLPISKVANAIHVYPTMNRIVRRLGDQRFLDKGIGPWTKRLFGRYKGPEN